MSSRPDYAMRPWPKQEAADLTGQRHGIVTVLRMVPTLGLGGRCLVRCDCGAERYVLTYNLKKNPPSTHRACLRKAED